MPYELRNRNVLVTGGSRGLGAVICQRFAQEGANVMINYVSSAENASIVAKHVETYGVKAFIVQGDTGILHDNIRIVQETLEKLGGLDIIVANAGWTKVCDFKDLNAMSEEEWNKVCFLPCAAEALF
ncbi:3-oxoacyl-[acyl-carrier protein] reductase [Exophiala aquamarina CBS 119918]|uniref:3-oxoacyl-[acyl-carrier-protein] reductase n=1 Tax=Exophiala aquamarina CBS 119918 TaxID=1182545 RepID=A0A072PNG8_9EURO|nr:3-oxoacyl-[acyl-carrier protein] reductase [Exophiala aquamarina CBS 119918]KEF57080.1 3-oxoacyl-[acyl-carrier protein] reductase [Exophiala aquamarina CBS 119918]